MDTRKALPEGYQLLVLSEQAGGRVYTIEKEIGRGGSCIVYQASYSMNTGSRKTVRIKEYYPYKLRIVRDRDGSLSVAESDRAVFTTGVEQFCRNFDLIHKMFSGGMSDSAIEVLDLYSANQTKYSVSTFSPEHTLATTAPETMKDCFTIAVNIAYVIGKVHEAGYLYLDLKPENVLLSEGQNLRVLLCDFDSLVPLRDSGIGAGWGDIRLSYSSGFAPLELRLGKRNALGAHSDIYSLGAVLFYLLFQRVPNAFDCEKDAEYDFPKIREAYAGSYRDLLFFRLRDFFRKTLVSFYQNRYPDIGQARDALLELVALADRETPFICSSVVCPPASFVGRKAELKEITDWFENGSSICLCVTGIGGIGKSALIQKFLDDRRKDSNTILYLQYHDSLKETISDDFFAKINTVEKMPSENGDQYYQRKLKAFRDCVGKRSILAIDHFKWNRSDDLNLLLDIGWRVILISREEPPTDTFPQIAVSSLPEEEQRELFEHHLGRSLKKTEIVLFQKIAGLIDGHTLVLELIAKQIVASFLSLEQAAGLIEQKSFSRMAPESVNYTKDGRIYQNKLIRDIIDGLFDSAQLTEEEHALLKTVSLFEIPVEIAFLQKAMYKRSKDIFHRLDRIGFLEQRDRTVFLHPVIREAICGWDWSERDRKDAFQIVWELFSFFYFEYNKQFKTTRERDSLLEEKKILLQKKTDFKKAIENADYEQRNHLREVFFSDSAPFEINRLPVYTLYACALTEDAQAEKLFGKARIYLDLELYLVTTFFRADTKKIEHLLQNPYFQGDADELLLIRPLVSLYLFNGEQGKAEDLLKRAEDLSKKLKDPTTRGIYYLTLTDYYLFKGLSDPKFRKRTKETLKNALHGFKSGKHLILYLSCLCDEVLYMTADMVLKNETAIQKKQDEILAQTDLQAVSEEALFQRLDDAEKRILERQAAKIEKILQEIRQQMEQFPSPPPSIEAAYLRSDILFRAVMHEDPEKIKQELNALKKVLPQAAIGDFERMGYFCWPITVGVSEDLEKEAEEWANAGLEIYLNHSEEPLYAQIAMGFYDVLLNINNEDPERIAVIRKKVSDLIAKFPEIEPPEWFEQTWKEKN